MPTFTEKHAEWTMAMRGDDSRPRNSIHSQIVELVDSAAWYRVVLLAREIAPRGESASRHHNGAFHCWIDTTFSDSFFVRTRRLAGVKGETLSGKRSCYSLRALIADLRKHRDLLTRENLLSLDQLPFDLLAADKSLTEYLSNNLDEDGWPEIPLPMDVRRSRARNSEIDRLSGVPENKRALADVVSDKVFADLEARLDSATSDLILVTNKLVAHASTLESREHDKTNDVETTRVTIKDLWNALECLCRSVAGLDGWLINRASHKFLPDMHCHNWNGIDFPLVESANIPKLKKLWKILEDEAADWGNPNKAL